MRVSIICFDSGGTSELRLDGAPVAQINADLSASVDLTQAARLIENGSVVFQGFKFGGPFEIPEAEAIRLLREPMNPNRRSNSSVLRQWFNGMDIVQRPTRRWCVHFGSFGSEADAALFEAPFDLLQKQWKAEQASRLAAGQRPLRHGEPEKAAAWWLFQRPRPELQTAFAGLTRFIATAEVAKHRVFVWFEKGALGSGSVYCFARDDDTTFGILHSRMHELWALRLGTSLEDRPRYTPSTTFETFPFPEGLTPNIPAADYADDPRAKAIASAAKKLNELREAWLNPDDLVRREPEVVPGYPDRILPVSEEAAKELKKRTLTNLYNQRPAWLDHAHRDLDTAVAAAYGWTDWGRDGLSDEVILERLFALNQQRAAAEARGG